MIEAPIYTRQYSSPEGARHVDGERLPTPEDRVLFGHAKDGVLHVLQHLGIPYPDTRILNPDRIHYLQDNPDSLLYPPYNGQQDAGFIRPYDTPLEGFDAHVSVLLRGAELRQYGRSELQEPELRRLGYRVFDQNTPPRNIGLDEGVLDGIRREIIQNERRRLGRLGVTQQELERYKQQQQDQQLQPYTHRSDPRHTQFVVKLTNIVSSLNIPLRDIVSEFQRGLFNYDSSTFQLIGKALESSSMSHDEAIRLVGTLGQEDERRDRALEKLLFG